MKKIVLLTLASCAILASPAAAETSTSEELCRTAYQWDKMDERIARYEASSQSVQLDYEAFVGRLEMLMHERKLTDNEKLLARFSCDVYLGAIGDAMRWIQKDIQQAFAKIPK